jgi:hypothetical protein
MASRDPKRELLLICDSQSFSVKKTLLMEQFNLFLEKPHLLGKESYTIQANVPVSVFLDFLKAV